MRRYHAVDLVTRVCRHTSDHVGRVLWGHEGGKQENVCGVCAVCVRCVGVGGARDGVRCVCAGRGEETVCTVCGGNVSGDGDSRCI
jgi:hypothetical protein